MESKTILKIISEEGRVTLKDKDGLIFDLVAPQSWVPEKDDPQGVFLLFDLFQIRGISEQFSEVALDIVEFTEKPVIFHSPKSRSLAYGPSFEGKVKFLMLKKGYWNDLLFNFGKPLIYQRSVNKITEYQMNEIFPVAHRSLYLGPEGDVKIIT